MPIMMRKTVENIVICLETKKGKAHVYGRFVKLINEVITIIRILNITNDPGRSYIYVIWLVVHAMMQFRAS